MVISITFGRLLDLLDVEGDECRNAGRRRRAE
jgi:hypothetical protein